MKALLLVQVCSALHCMGMKGNKVIVEMFTHRDDKVKICGV